MRSRGRGPIPRGRPGGTPRADAGLALVTVSTGRQLQRLPTGASEVVGTAFSPDGQKIVFVSDRAAKDSRKVFVMPADGGTATRLINQSGSTYQMVPDWQPLQAKEPCTITGTIHDDHLVGTPGMGFYYIAMALDFERIAIGSPAMVQRMFAQLVETVRTMKRDGWCAKTCSAANCWSLA